MRQLTDNQRRWAEAYVGPARFNASEAARIVGIAEAYGRQMRAVTCVTDYVEQLMAERAKSLALSRDRVVEELVAVGMSQITDVIAFDGQGRLVIRDFDTLPRHVRSGIKKITIKDHSRVTAEDGTVTETVGHVQIEMHEKVSALSLLAQATGLLRPDGSGRYALGQDEERAWDGKVVMIGPGASEEEKQLALMPTRGKDDNRTNGEEITVAHTLASAAASERIRQPIDVTGERDDDE